MFRPALYTGVNPGFGLTLVQDLDCFSSGLDLGLGQDLVRFS